MPKNSSIQDIQLRSAEIDDLILQKDSMQRAIAFADSVLILQGLNGSTLGVDTSPDLFDTFKSSIVTSLQSTIEDKVTDFNTEYPDINYTELADVTGFTATPDEVDKLVVLEWEAVTNAEQYKVYRQQAAAGAIDFTKSILIATAELLTYTDGNVVKETDYNYFVVASSTQYLDSDTPATDSVTTPDWDD